MRWSGSLRHRLSGGLPSLQLVNQLSPKQVTPSPPPSWRSKQAPTKALGTLGQLRQALETSATTRKLGAGAYKARRHWLLGGHRAGYGSRLEPTSCDTRGWLRNCQIRSRLRICTIVKCTVDCTFARLSNHKSTYDLHDCRTITQVMICTIIKSGS